MPNIRYTSRMSTSGSRNNNINAPYFPAPTRREAERNASRTITSTIHHNQLTFNLEFMAVHNLEKLERPIATFFELDLDAALSLINKIRLRGLYNPHYKSYERIFNNQTNANEELTEEQQQEEEQTTSSIIHPLPPASSPSATHFLNRPTAIIEPLSPPPPAPSLSHSSSPEHHESTFSSHLTGVIISDDDDDDNDVDDPSDEGNSYLPSSPSSPEDVSYSPTSPVHIPQSPSSLSPPRPSSPPPPPSPAQLAPSTQPPTATILSSSPYNNPSLYRSSVLTPLPNNNIFINRPPTPFMYFYEGNPNIWNEQFRHIGLTQSNITFDQVPTPQGFPPLNNDQYYN